ncbi:MAG: DNA primase [Kiritimatiellae bacterium]|nr:DNA primase [Kiritimatiellia bacterium]
MAVTEAIIEEIKARTDLADLIASYGIQIRRAGASVKACCPFHNEKTPSFNINTSKGFYHCFGCGESGDAITFVQKMEGLGFLDAARKLAEQCGVKIEERSDPADGQRKRLYALMLELAQFYHRCLRQTKAAQIARDYLKSRDLGEAAQEEFLIGYAPVGAAPILAWAEKHRYTPAELELAGVLKGDYHRFGGRLMFTIRDRRGRVVAFSGRQLVENKKAGKYVNSPETPIFKKSQVLFGFDRAAGHIVKAPHREIICCEGQIDTIRLHLCGFTTAVASQGTAFTEEHAEMVKKVADAALLLYDDDAAGHKATVKVARLLLARELPVRVVSLPDGDDPDSFLRRHGAAALQQRIDAAESIVSFQCRAEKAKEANPQSIDAVARISHAVLETVAACPSAILRATMVDEAAKLLALPVAALNEELEKARAAVAAAERGRELAQRRRGAEKFPDDEAPMEVPDDSAEVPRAAIAESREPPPELEREFMEFLMVNEGNADMSGQVGEFLPDKVFAHDFTRRFVMVWRDGVATDEDLLAPFADALDDSERGWFDKILSAAGRKLASSDKPTDRLQDFVCRLWRNFIERRRSMLPAVGDVESNALRMKFTLALKRIGGSDVNVDWNKAKEIIRNFIKGDNDAWT